MTDLIILTSAALYREAWRALLTGQPGIYVVATISQPQELHQLIPFNQQPTTILIDLALPDPAVAHQIQEIAPTAGLFYLVDGYELTEMVALLQAGAAGCLVREATVADLVRGIIAAGRDEIVLPPEWATKVLVALTRGDGVKRPSTPTLTEREQDVLQLLAQGMTNKDIAQSLFLSVRTIEAHLRNIYGKLAVASRTEAVLWAVQHGYES